MGNSKNIHSGERLSFFDLFERKRFRVLIPIIQRDYAQGRKSKKEVRTSFLNALYQYLEENEPNRDLDFVYGSLKSNGQSTDFIPLDGQQRLTTLFLLHWYLYQISNNQEKRAAFRNALLNNGKPAFSYETRPSASDFCASLMQYGIDIENNLEPNGDLIGDETKGTPSEIIKDASWFFLSWQFDPTIQSMLVMLDDIHQRFKGRRDFFDKLVATDQPAITFLFLNLNEFQLTDDLYIKMNARGKPLTPFENFKAKFEQYLERMSPVHKHYLRLDGISKEVTLKEYFAYNIDNKWADLFWNYRTLQNRSSTIIDDTFDDEMMNFIRVIITHQYAKNVAVSPKDRSDGLDYLLGTQRGRKLPDYTDLISFSKYEELNALTSEGISLLISAFDCLTNGNKEIQLYLSKDYRHYYNENAVFENALKHDFESNHQRLSFHAYIRFLIQNGENPSGINQWMRVIHNLSHPENTVIDSATELAGAIQTIERLLPFSNNILDYLTQEDAYIPSFSSHQVWEEKIKAHLITKSKAWKEIIETTEKHGYFNGQIGFLLEFSGIIKHFKDNHHCNWSSEEDATYFNKLSGYATKAQKVFDENYERRVNDKHFVFERAVLTKGDYLTNASQFRKNLLSTNLTKNNIKRDHSWKRLLRITDEENWKQKRLLVQQVFDDKRFDENDLENSLNNICKDKTSTWRDYLITCPSLIAYCHQGFIRYENRNNILLYGQSQSNFYYAELFSYHLWKTHIEPQKENFSFFNDVYYRSARGINQAPCIVMENFRCNDLSFKMKIYYNYKEDPQRPFVIEIKELHNEDSGPQSQVRIQTTLSGTGFHWNHESNIHIKRLESSYEVEVCLNQVSQSLKQLQHN